MNKKDVKTKPKTSPKTVSKEPVKKAAVKGKESAVNTVKDTKTAMKDAVIRKAAQSKLGTEKNSEQPQKADTEAAESVESAAYVVSDTVYHKSKAKSFWRKFLCSMS